MRKANYRPPFSPEDFESAIASIRNGKIPDCMDELKAYINHTTRELVTYAQAVTECAVRQKTQIQTLREAIGKATGLKHRGKQGGQQMAEMNNLTTTITSEEYRNLLWRIGQADRLAEAVAADWLASTGFSFNKPSDATLEALRMYDEFLYCETEKNVAEAEAKNEEDKRKLLECFYDQPVAPISTTDKDNQIRVEVVDLPDLEPKITCDSGNN